MCEQVLSDHYVTLLRSKYQRREPAAVSVVDICLCINQRLDIVIVTSMNSQQKCRF